MVVCTAQPLQRERATQGELRGPLVLCHSRVPRVSVSIPNVLRVLSCPTSRHLSPHHCLLGPSLDSSTASRRPHLTQAIASHRLLAFLMSLSSLLQYNDSDDEGEVDEVKEPSRAPPLPPSSPPRSLPPPPPPCITPLSALPPLPSSTSSAAKKRKLPSVESEPRPTRPSTASSSASSTLTFLSASPSSSGDSSSSPFSIFPSSPSTAPAASDDLFSLLPPPKREQGMISRPLRSSALPAFLNAAPSTSHSTPTAPPAVSSFVVPSTDTLPPSPPPPPTSSAVSPQPSLPPPPGIRAAAKAIAQSHPPLPAPSFSPLPSLFPSISSALPPPRIAYSTTSPYAAASPPSSTFPPSSLPTPWDEPRMLRQFYNEGADFIDIRGDDLISPQSYTPAPPSGGWGEGAAAEVKLRTSYWSAREGKEVVVDGVEGRQKRAHQINSLALQAKKHEADILNARAASSNIRRQARAKYGW